MITSIAVVGPLLVVLPLLVLLDKDRSQAWHCFRWRLAVLWMAPHCLAPWLFFLAVGLWPWFGKGGEGGAGLGAAFLLLFYLLFVVGPAYVALAVLAFFPPNSFPPRKRSLVRMAGAAVLVIGLLGARALGIN